MDVDSWRYKINEMNKNRQATKEFDKEAQEDVGGQSLIAVKDYCKQELARSKLRQPAVRPGIYK